METLKRSRGTMVLLVVGVAALVVIAAVLVGQVLPTGGESAARQAARQEATKQATETCTLTLPANVRDDVYKGCIKREVRARLVDWDAAHPNG